MEEKILELRKKVIKASLNPDFIHHRWFIKYHLEIVEKIAIETCDTYKEANKDLVRTLVWIHDYGKILGIRDDMDKIIAVSEKLMKDVGFENDFISQVIEYLKTFESKMEFDLNSLLLVPKAVKDFPLAFIIASIMGMAFMGFNGFKF